MYISPLQGLSVNAGATYAREKLGKIVAEKGTQGPVVYNTLRDTGLADYDADTGDIAQVKEFYGMDI